MANANETIVKNSADAARAAIEAAKNKVTGATPAVEASKADGMPAEKKLSPKHKSSRGVDPSLVTTWVPFDQNKELHETIQNAAKHRGVNVPNMMADLLKKAVDAELTSLQEDAAKYEPKVKVKTLDEKLQEMSETELEAFVAKQEAQMKALQAKIASLKK